MLTANNKQFESICESLIFFILFRQWRYFYWVTINKCMLNEFFFNTLFKKFIDNMSICHGIIDFYIMFFCYSFSFIICHLSPKINASIIFNHINHMNSFPTWFKFNLIITILYSG